MKPKLLWVTDPWETLDHAKDTTLRLIEESVRLGIPSYWCDVKSIRWETEGVWLDAALALRVREGRARDAFEFEETRSLSPDQFTRILYRTDPPVDLAYLHPLRFLVLGSQKKRSCEIVAPWPILFSGNEKLEGAFLGSLMPPGISSSQWERLKAFGQSEGRTVMKPLYQAQSKGIELLDWSSAESQEQARRSLHEATDGFLRPVLLQRYLPGILEGEQRLWYLNGKLLAVAKKKPKSGEFKINMDQGATLIASTLNAKEKKAAAQIGKHLRARKIRLAAVDLIEGYVTDFNFTSPGLLAPMETLLGKNLARPILKSLIQPWK